MQTPIFNYKRPYEVFEYNGIKKYFKNTGTLRNMGRTMCVKLGDFRYAHKQHSLKNPYVDCVKSNVA